MHLLLNFAPGDAKDHHLQRRLILSRHLRPGDIAAIIILAIVKPCQADLAVAALTDEVHIYCPIKHSSTSKTDADLLGSLFTFHFASKTLRVSLAFSW